MKTRATAYFRHLQNEICTALERFEPTARFLHDRWERPGGGGGESRVLEGGDFLEKGGVNFSEVHGELSDEMARAMPGEGAGFWAAGTSLVLHPRNPHVPTVHCNFRMIQRGETFWFGGGADLTPYYPVSDDIRHFHRAFKAACDPHEPTFHARFKAWCDRYFFIPHREECRGVGGIFFDHLTPAETGLSGEALFAFVQQAGNAFLPAYLPIAERRHATPWNDREREFQLYRRGRYVEFNLMYDRGTIFGLKTNGRIESILMSLPPLVTYRYDWRPEPGTPEAFLYECLKPRDWAAGE